MEQNCGVIDNRRGMEDDSPNEDYINLRNLEEELLIGGEEGRDGFMKMLDEYFELRTVLLTK